MNSRKLSSCWGRTVPFEKSLAMESQSLRLRRLLVGGYMIETVPRALPGHRPAKQTAAAHDQAGD